MTPRRWQRIEQDLIVTPNGICASCPRCGQAAVLTDENGIDACPCGTLLRVTVEAREPWQPRGGAEKSAEIVLAGEA